MTAPRAILFGFASVFLSLNTHASFLYPCNGAQGTYYTNPDASAGGFIASTATVDSTIIMTPEAQICERATVIEGATISDRAKISGRATVRGKVFVGGRAEIFGEAYVINPYGEDLTINESVRIYGNAFVQGTVVLTGSSEVFGWGKVLEFAQLLGASKVCGNKIVKAYTVLEDDTTNCVQK